MTGRAGLWACIIAASLASAVAAQKGNPPRAQTVVAPGVVGHWSADAPVTGAAFRSGPYTLSLDPVSETGALAPRLVAEVSGGGDAITLTGVAAYQDHVAADFVVARLDPKSSAPSIIFASYAGGAHCCMDIQIATPQRLGWTVHHLGEFDNEPLAAAPRDLDGDGAVELIIADDSVDYLFDSFGGSYQPIRVFGLRDGKIVDRSREPGFRKVIAADMARAEALCRKGQSGACPAYVADAARIGAFEHAWKVTMARVKPSFSFPEKRCGDLVIYVRCAAGKERPVPDYPTALRLFLAQRGYIGAQAVHSAARTG